MKKRELKMKAGKLQMIALLLWMPGVLMAESNIRFMSAGQAGAELHLEIVQSPLAPALDEIADKTGVLIHYSALPESMFNLICTGTTVTGILKCLLDNKADLIFRYAHEFSKEDQQNRLAEAWVVGTHGDLGQDAPLASRSSLSDTGSNAETRDSDETGKLLEMAVAENPQNRADAVAGLASGQVKAPLVRDALESALSDTNAEVRAQAVTGLAKYQGYDASAVLQSALQDGDVSVRLMAVDSAGDNPVLLQQALGDSDETVRAYAATKLEALSAQ
jgi:hypothetical protein